MFERFGLHKPCGTFSIITIEITFFLPVIDIMLITIIYTTLYHDFLYFTGAKMICLIQTGLRYQRVIIWNQILVRISSLAYENHNFRLYPWLSWARTRQSWLKVVYLHYNGYVKMLLCNVYALNTPTTTHCYIVCQIWGHKPQKCHASSCHMNYFSWCFPCFPVCLLVYCVCVYITRVVLC